MTVWTINKRAAPPGDWQAIVPETGMRVAGASYEDFREAVYENLMLNGHEPPEDMDAFATNLICQRIPGYCRQVTGPAERIVPHGESRSPRRSGRVSASSSTTSKISIQDVQSGMQNFWRWFRARRPLVSTAEAERRGRICAQCRFNQPHVPCPTCSKVYRLIGRMTASKEHQYTGHLQVCAVCKCCNKTQGWIPAHLLRRRPEHRYPSHCWKLELPIEEVANPPQITRE